MGDLSPRLRISNRFSSFKPFHILIKFDLSTSFPPLFVQKKRRLLRFELSGNAVQIPHGCAAASAGPNVNTGGLSFSDPLFPKKTPPAFDAVELLLLGSLNGRKAV